jgi:hypothetical protein
MELVGIFGFKQALRDSCGDNSSVVSALHVSFDLSFHPEAVAGILRLSIDLRIARNKSRGTATSAI